MCTAIATGALSGSDTDSDRQVAAGQVSVAVPLSGVSSLTQPIGAKQGGGPHVLALLDLQVGLGSQAFVPVAAAARPGASSSLRLGDTEFVRVSADSAAASGSLQRLPEAARPVHLRGPALPE
jgi:hypothetical protein